MQAITQYTVTETLSRNGRSVLYRAIREVDRVPVVIKTLDADHSPQDAERLNHEFEIESSLALDALIKPLALDIYQGMPALVIEDCGAQSLDQLIPRPMGDPARLEQGLDLAVQIAGAVAELHAHGVIHKDLKPENILVQAGRVKLADLSLASRLPRAAQPAPPPRVIEGSFPYMSPEQTGRIGRAVDSRSDLYSLGVTLYQMLTGRLPFQGHDPSEWIHCHVALAPASPSQLLPGLPEPIEQIVLKLLSKNADERYQTARGLRHDLQRCLEAWRRSGHIEPFPLGERDRSDQLKIPRRLYGRDRERHALLAAYERAAQEGASEVVLVAGAPGIGKSTLAHALEEPISRRGGLFAAGKFDPLQRDVPYSAFMAAFRDVVLDLLTGDDDSIARWRKRLQGALGSNGQLIADVIPPLELLLGKQPPVAGVGPVEAQSRFRRTLQNFIEALAQNGRALVLFLDDLQWADADSLRLLQDLLAHREIGGLLLIGAYRDRDVTPDHPLRTLVERGRKEGAQLSELALGPLAAEDLCTFVAEALQSSRGEVASLADLVFKKTGANPFFAVQFLTELCDERLIAFDAELGRWTWEIAKIRERGITENVVELTIGKLKRLSAPAQESLRTFACLGHRAEVGTLAAILGRSTEEVHALLSEAVEAGFLIPNDGTYRFIHDRIREAAYALVGESSRSAEHLRIGRLLLSQADPSSIEERVFDIANQLNLGASLITDEGERESLRRLDLRAGRKAKSSVAYASARSYLAHAERLLPTDAWVSHYDEAFPLCLELGECDYLAGDLEAADASLNRLLVKARSDLDRAAVHQKRVALSMLSSRFDEAARAGFAGLQLLGVTFPEAEPDIPAALEEETRRIRELLSARSVEDLMNAPAMVAPEQRMMLRLLIDCMPPVYNARPQYHALLLAKAARITLRYGNAPESSTLYVVYAILLIALFEDMRRAFELAEVSLGLAERLGDRPNSTFVRDGVAFQIDIWRRPLAAGISVVDQIFDEEREIGSPEFAGISAICAAWMVAESGAPLDAVLTASEKYLSFARTSHSEIVLAALQLIRQVVPAMRGTTRSPGTLDGDGFDENNCLEYFRRTNFGAGLTLHRVLKQMTSFFFCRYEEALSAAVENASAPGPVSAFMYDATHHFFRGLSAAAMSRAQPDRKPELGRILEEELRRHKVWSDHCPENFLNRYALLSAEAARIEGRELEAMQAYERAIRSARENGFVQNEALAFELASEFYRSRGYQSFADLYLRSARACYRRWGADGKVRQMERLHPEAFEQSPRSSAPSSSSTSEQLDLLSVTKASQTISGETDLEKLLGTLLRVVLEQGGAGRACLILARGDDLAMEAEAVASESGVTTRLLPSLPISKRDGERAPIVPYSVVQYARRALQPVILEDATRSPGNFHADPYFAIRRPRSVLCLPVLRQAELVGLVYLENCLVAGVFTPDRLMALSLVASQAAISVENALLLAQERGLRAAAEEAKDRSNFLAEAGALLSGSLEYEMTLQELAQLSVHSLAESCEIDLVDGSDLRCLATAGANPAMTLLLEQLANQHVLRWSSPRSAVEVARSGQPILLANVTDELLKQRCDDEDHLRLVRALGIRSAMIVPLRARGQVLGVLSLGSTTAGRYGSADLELAQDLARRAAVAIDNARLYRDAQQAIQLRDEFLSCASHELRTPIQSIHLAVQVLERDLGPKGPSGPSRMFRIAVRQTERLTALVNQLLDVSRIQSGQMILSPEQFELCAEVRQIVDRMRVQVDSSGASLSVSAKEPIVCRWDRSRFDQLLTNLLSNALTYGEKKPIDVAVERAEIGREAGARIVVRDHGIGIPPDKLPHIFERFFRATSTRHYGGLGLGLFIAREVAQAHGGSLWAESEVGRGSSFTLELPLEPPERNGDGS